MQTELGRARLSTGEDLRLLGVEAPDAAWQGRLGALLGHKRAPYLGQIQAALAGPLGGLQTLFYVGAVAEEPVTCAVVAGAAGAGVFGHVYTVPAWRRRGAAAALHRALAADLPARGYRCLTLGTNPEGHARRIYEGIGFRQVTPGSGSMLWGDGQPPPGALAASAAEWADWGWISAAGCAPPVPGEDRPRSRLLGPGGPGHVEGPFAAALQEGRPLLALRQGGAAVGWAEFSPAAAAVLGAVALDFYVRPECAAGTGVLFAALPWPERPVVCAARARGPVLQAAGFRAVAELPAPLGTTLWLRA